MTGAERNDNMAIYLHDATFRSEGEEWNLERAEQRTCFESFYPLRLFPAKGLRRVEFDPVTIFYGGQRIWQVYSAKHSCDKAECFA